MFISCSLYSCLKNDIPAFCKHLPAVINISAWRVLEIVQRSLAPVLEQKYLCRSGPFAGIRRAAKQGQSSFTSRHFIPGTGCISLNKRFPKLSLHNDQHRDETTEEEQNNLNPSVIHTSNLRNWSSCCIYTNSEGSYHTK